MSPSDSVEKIEPQAPEGRAQKRSLTWVAVALALLSIVLTELVSFGPMIRSVGFYLDDWITVRLLHDGPRALWPSFTHYLVSDPRVVVRPVEAFYYALLYCLFGMKPLGYHVVNAVLEVLASCFLFLALSIVSGNRSLALVAALILIVYPNHDATHYWATCSSETLSLALSMLSFWAICRGAEKRDWRWHAAAVVSFAASIFCYETFLPLLVLNAAGAFVVRRRSSTTAQALKYTALSLVPYLASVGLLLVYSRLIAPRMAHAQVHPIHFVPRLIFDELYQGIRINLPDQALAFFLPQTYIGIYFQAAPLAILGLVANTTCTAAALLIFQPGDRPLLHPLEVAALGLVVVLASYSIFGLNPEYTPMLGTILNRVNYGAALGIALLLAGLLAFLTEWQPFTERRVTVLVTSLVLIPLLLFSIATNRGLAQPWILSWQTQKIIARALASNRGKFQNGDAVILANCPRYVMWSPLFDGVWDFEPMLRLTAQNHTLKGGVVSERLEISRKELKDVSRGHLCNTYDFKRLFVVIPPDFDIIQIDDPEKFIRLIEKRGMTFGLKRETIAKWQRELADDVH